MHPGSAHLVKNDGQEDPISRSGCLKPASPAVLNWFKSPSDTEKVQVTRMFGARLPLIANELLTKSPQCPAADDFLATARVRAESRHWRTPVMTVDCVEGSVLSARPWLLPGL